MPNLLLVEDNELNRDMLSRRLRKRGYEIEIAVDGQEGLDRVKAARPEVLLELGTSVGYSTLWLAEGARQVGGHVITLDAVATKHELFFNIWGEHVSVVDTALTTAVCEARKAIDDDHRQQWAIRTLPRRGYRFIAPIAEGARV